MIERIKQYLGDLFCVYTIISVAGAVVNLIAGTKTSNENVLVMFLICASATFVLHLHRLFDGVSPLVMIIIQYLAACILIGVILLVVSALTRPVTLKGLLEYYRSFTIPYIILAGLYYYRVFSETRKQEELIREIQDMER